MVQHNVHNDTYNSMYKSVKTDPLDEVGIELSLLGVKLDLKIISK